MKQTLSALALVILLAGQAQDTDYVRRHYDKREYEIPMRDGTTLFTQVYSPKDKSRTYPMLMKRTCYSIGPYGEDQFARSLGPSSFLMEDGYIFVYQDVRGRYMSEGEFDNMRPNIPGNKKGDVDESSDTFDTIEWLLKNVKGHNGKVGQWGISYPGFYTAAAIPDAHPALRASSPQAPVGDF
ncbi:MAG: CocE/NonD family hydrolase, partial [Cyclobacteriaceae bacterium]|nr:CocE/NonD family hydrolase [Cyclobacteriaceae bacterium]